MPQITKLHLTMLNQRSKARRKREPAAVNEHLLVDMKIAIPVLPSIGLYISDDAKHHLRMRPMTFKDETVGVKLYVITKPG